MKPDEPLEALQACHARIEEQLRTLERLAQRGSPDRAAAEVVRYFDTSGAQHHRDEDQDLFPLLRARAAAPGLAPIDARDVLRFAWQSAPSSARAWRHAAARSSIAAWL